MFRQPITAVSQLIGALRELNRVSQRIPGSRTFGKRALIENVQL
jgi:hypothetical protein